MTEWPGVALAALHRVDLGLLAMGSYQGQLMRLHPLAQPHSPEMETDAPHLISSASSSCLGDLGSWGRSPGMEAAPLGAQRCARGETSQLRSQREQGVGLSPVVAGRAVICVCLAGAL